MLHSHLPLILFIASWRPLPDHSGHTCGIRMRLTAMAGEGDGDAEPQVVEPKASSRTRGTATAVLADVRGGGGSADRSLRARWQSALVGRWTGERARAAATGNPLTGQVRSASTGRTNIAADRSIIQDVRMAVRYGAVAAGRPPSAGRPESCLDATVAKAQNTSTPRRNQITTIRYKTKHREDQTR